MRKKINYKKIKLKGIEKIYMCKNIKYPFFLT